MTSGLGSLTVTTHVTIAITGVYGTGAVSTLTVWGEIQPGQTPDWTGVTDSQSPSWSEVSDSQTPDWKEVA
jgi:hypothetical protein